MNIRTQWRRFKQRLPPSFYPLLTVSYAAYVRLLCVYLSATESPRIAASGFPRLPPPLMRHHISGKADVETFLSLGEGITRLVETSLAEVGVELSRCERVLDFGCGCGRLLLWMHRFFPDCQFYGTDINPQAITWCQKNLSEVAIFGENAPAPPIQYDTDFFDVVYATSVFTHLTEEHQFQWLEELKRILKPGGVLLASLHGKHYRDLLLPPAVAEQVERDGFLAVSPHTTLPGVFPGSYKDTYVTEEYVRERFAAIFNVLKYIPGEPGQDIVLLQKPR